MSADSKYLLSLYDWSLIVGIVATSLAYSIFTNDLDILGFVAGVSGVLCVVLCTKRSIFNYVFGIVNVSLYAYISLRSGIYGDFALNALYYFPMQFVGLYLWNKNRDADEPQTVESRRMTAKQRILLLAVCVATVLSTGFILARYTADPMPYKDAFTTVLSVIAMFLMVKAFMEQWVLWILTNLVSLVMWITLAIKNEPSAGLMAAMWFFYLLNSINGLRVWYKQSISCN